MSVERTSNDYSQDISRFDPYVSPENLISSKLSQLQLKRLNSIEKHL